MNDAYRLAPFADICYFADTQWWNWHKEKAEFNAFAGQKCSIWNSGNTIMDPEVHILRNADAPHNGLGLSLDPEKLVTGSNSGFQALNLAALTGVRQILLLGYDARVPPKGAATHWFGNHPVREPDTAFEVYRKSFMHAAAAIKAAGIRVINCSPGSAIDVFDRMDIRTALGFGEY